LVLKEFFGVKQCFNKIFVVLSDAQTRFFCLIDVKMRFICLNDVNITLCHFDIV